jgi:hypothetical protein
MEPYKNQNGNSGVVAYEIGADSIKVQFSDGSTYLYTYKKSGKRNVEKMKKLALAGEGLSSFISSVVHKRYATKLE